MFKEFIAVTTKSLKFYFKPRLFLSAELKQYFKTGLVLLLLK